MRLSDRYIGRQILVGTLFAILLLGTILVMGSLFQNLRMLLVELGAPLSVVWEFLIATLPFALIYTIPWAFLASVLLVFGRLSSDNELTGFRVAGMSLGRLAMPVFVIGALLSTACLWLNLQVAPSAKSMSKSILLRAFSMDPRSMLQAAAERDGLERLQDKLRNARVYVEKSNDSIMEGLHLFQLPDPGSEKGKEIYIHAMKAEAVADKELQEFRLHLYDATFFESSTDHSTPEVVRAGESVPVVIPYSETRPEKVNPGTLSNSGIREFIERVKIEQASAVEESARLSAELRALEAQDSPSAGELKVAAGRLNLERGKMITRDRTVLNFEAEIHRRYASSLACIAFAFIGVPLGIKARRKDTSSGLVLSLLIGLAYFLCGMVGGDNTSTMMLGAWLPNIVCVALGLFLLRRARFR